ncbi:hypothetical protein Drorol1_Dr00002290 [Drosera rotundifolia]
MKLRYAMVCSSNQNRSLEAHSLLKKQGFDVSSYGTGTHVKIHGPSIREPNIYEFGTPYKQMFDELHRKDPNLNFLSISRRWNSGDKITLELPLGLRTERLVDDRMTMVPFMLSFTALMCLLVYLLVIMRSPLGQPKVYQIGLHWFPLTTTPI